MDWRQEALGRLRRYESLRNATINMSRELSQLRSAAFRTRACMPEDFLLNNIVRRQELRNALDRNRSQVAQTDRALRCLRERDQRILQRMYIYPERDAVSRLCHELGIGRSSLYRNRDQALRRFTVAMFGTAAIDRAC